MSSSIELKSVNDMTSPTSPTPPPPLSIVIDPSLSGEILTETTSEKSEIEGGGDGDEAVDDEVIEILKKAAVAVEAVQRVDLSGRELRFLPEAFGKLCCLVVFDVSHNQLEILPDAIAGLHKLEVLDVSSNFLKSLPDSIGLLPNLKILNVSGNKLNALPESISACSLLEELDASFNNISSLPSNIGFGLFNLKKLCIHLNKIRLIPSSICEMKSLRYLDAHFNELHYLPNEIGKLTNLEVLNVGSNFSDLTEVPESINDLANLQELDLSNNQIRVLPDSFFRLEKLTKLKLDGNPLALPPLEVAMQGAEAVREFMVKRWLDILAEEQRRQELEENKQAPGGWLEWGTSWLNSIASGVSGTVGGYTKGQKDDRDLYLDQQF